jgi:NAD(P)-dependent dehydrogenase (short-subunit alcohol dehydrogenase family)
MHSHDHNEIVLLLDGSCTMLDPDGPTLHAGDLMVLIGGHEYGFIADAAHGRPRYHAPVVVVVNGSTEVAAGLTAAGFDVAPAYPRVFDALVHVPDLAVAAVRTTVAQTDEAEWDARGEALLRDALHACRTAFGAMHGRDGRIVLVTPTVGLVGAAGLAPLALAAEGMRTLAKTAARQWGNDGITVNCVAPSLDVLGIAHDVEGTVAPALGRTPDCGDLITVIASLLREVGRAITGTTITVDGGVVMAP